MTTRIIIQGFSSWKVLGSNPKIMSVHSLKGYALVAVTLAIFMFATYLFDGIGFANLSSLGFVFPKQSSTLIVVNFVKMFFLIYSSEVMCLLCWFSSLREAVK